MATPRSVADCTPAMSEGSTSRSSAFLGLVDRSRRSPAVHFAVLGAVLFASSAWWSAPRSVDRPRLVVPASRLAKAERAFVAENRRPPAAAEKATLVERLLDEEILFQHAMTLGLHHAEVPRRRLARIARFVEPSGDRAPADAELARRAVELGLHEGDYVTRRVLVDAAERLISAAPRLAEPSEETLAIYLEQHGEHFRDDDRIRISHVLLAAARRSQPVADAGALLVRLRRDNLSPADATALSDPGLVPSHLPLLAERGLERRFGPDFTDRLPELPEGEWSGPVVSRHGAHLVFVHERRPGRIPELARVRGKALALWREAAAERWLAERLRQLRAEVEVVVASEVRS